jgi:hypothetical protein
MPSFAGALENKLGEYGNDHGECFSVDLLSHGCKERAGDGIFG